MEGEKRRGRLPQRERERKPSVIQMFFICKYTVQTLPQNLGALELETMTRGTFTDLI